MNRVEALLFLTPRPLSAKEIASILNLREEEVLEAINKLKERYSNTSLMVEEFAGSFRLNVKEEYRGIAKEIGLVPEFTRSELKVIARILKEGEVPLSALKRMYKGSEELVKRLRSYGFVVTKKSGRSVIVKKTKIMERYFGFIQGA